MTVDVYMHVAPSGKAYVGIASKGMHNRWRAHVAAAGRGSRLLFHRAIRKYGAESFGHELLEQCDTQAIACEAERRWIEKLRTQRPRGYNITAGGEGTLGRPHSEDTKAVLRAKQGQRDPATRTHTEETRRKIGDAHRGRTIPEERRAKQSTTMSGRTLTPEHRANIAAGGRGRKWSAAQRAKFLASRKGVSLSAEACENIRRAAIGRSVSAAGREAYARAAEQRARDDGGRFG